MRLPVTRAPRSARSGPPVNVPTALLIALIVSLAIWIVPGANVLLLPIHPYLTFVHESWHVLVALLTGGQVSGVHLFGLVGGGVTNTVGGNLLLIASAGYVGSAITGSVFLALLPQPGALRFALLLQYLWLVVVALRWDHDINAWLYLLVFGGVLYLLANKLPERWFAVAMGFLALQLALAVIGDLRTLLFLSAFSTAHSDALVAAQVTHLPRLFWAILWSAISGVLLFFAFRSALGYQRRLPRPRPSRPLAH